MILLTEWHVVEETISVRLISKFVNIEHCLIVLFNNKKCLISRSTNHILKLRNYKNRRGFSNQNNCFFLFPKSRLKSYGGESDDSDNEVADVDVEKLPPIDIPTSENRLQYTYCLWYHRGSYKIKSPSVCYLPYHRTILKTRSIYL